MLHYWDFNLNQPLPGNGVRRGNPFSGGFTVVEF